MEGKYKPERHIALHSMSLAHGIHHGTRSVSCCSFLRRTADNTKPFCLSLHVVNPTRGESNNFYLQFPLPDICMVCRVQGSMQSLLQV